MAWFKPAKRPSHKAYAVVTGAGSGIGRSFALQLAARGGQVVCSDIQLEAAEATAQLIREQGGTAYAVSCDVRDSAQVQQLAEQAEQLLGHGVTLLINNAGVGLGGKFDEVSLEDWQWCLQINLWGVIYGCYHFVPKFKAQGYGNIINVASAASYTAAPEMSAYNVSKSGVRSLSESLSAELKKFNIRVNVLCPTLVPTNIIKNGRLPSRYKNLADHALMNWAMVNSDDVARKSLDQLDHNRLYTIPQIDAKLLWLSKRFAPQRYSQFLAWSYQWLR